MTGKKIMQAALNADSDKDSLDQYSFLKGWNAAVWAIIEEYQRNAVVSPTLFLAVPDADKKETE